MLTTIYCRVSLLLYLCRLPDNFNVLKKISIFSVDNILRTNKSPIIEVLEYFNEENIESIRLCYEKIHFLKWENTNDTLKFWAEVLEFRDAGGVNTFAPLANFAVKLMSLPWSNAEVERVFSQVQLVKNSLRNRMHLKMLNAILSIRLVKLKTSIVSFIILKFLLIGRYGLKRSGMCCFNYTLPASYLKMISESAKYNDSVEDVVDIDDISLLLK